LPSYPCSYIQRRCGRPIRRKPGRKSLGRMGEALVGSDKGGEQVDRPQRERTVGKSRYEPSHENRSVRDRKCRDRPLRSKASVTGEGTGRKQPMNFPGSQRTACRHRVANESTEPLAGCLGVGAHVPTHSEDISYKPLAAKSSCACEWGGWGRLSEDGPGH
jgi:hypothetical protein